jgi:hypothetical protein
MPSSQCGFESCHRNVLNDNPAWREAFTWETPGQLEPQLTQPMPPEPITHVIDLNTNQSFCKKAVLGDRAITLEQAQDPSNDLYFNCEGCYIVLSPEK